MKEDMVNEYSVEGFCPITCNIKELNKMVKKQEKRGEAVSAAFYRGIRFSRTATAGATGGTIS